MSVTKKEIESYIQCAEHILPDCSYRNEISALLRCLPTNEYRNIIIKAKKEEVKEECFILRYPNFVLHCCFISTIIMAAILLISTFV